MLLTIYAVDPWYMPSNIFFSVIRFMDPLFRSVISPILFPPNTDILLTW